MQPLELRLGNYLFKTRSFWPVGLLLIGLWVAWFSDSAAPLKPLSFILCVTGLLIRFVTVGFSAPNTSGRNTLQGQVADSLNTTGMYSCCRHPLYFGNFLLWVGAASLVQNLWFLLGVVLFFSLYYRLIILSEEAFLKEKFGNEFLDWKEKTSAFFPKALSWKTPVASFRWLKVLFQEKSTFLNLVLVLWLFHQAGHLGKGDSFILYDLWNFLLAGVLIFYLVLKHIGKR